MSMTRIPNELDSIFSDKFEYHGPGCYETVNGRKIYIAGDLRDSDMYRGEYPFVGCGHDTYMSWTESGEAAAPRSGRR